MRQRFSCTARAGLCIGARPGFGCRLIRNFPPRRRFAFRARLSFGFGSVFFSERGFHPRFGCGTGPGLSRGPGFGFGVGPRFGSSPGLGLGLEARFGFDLRFQLRFGARLRLCFLARFRIGNRPAVGLGPGLGLVGGVIVCRDLGREPVQCFMRSEIEIRICSDGGRAAGKKSDVTFGQQLFYRLNQLRLRCAGNALLQFRQ
ncbi:MAG: hypothetical protein ACRESG_06290 [Gammaproteobacteria bacterium]